MTRPDKGDMEKRLIIAIALSVLIIVTFQALAPKPPAAPPPVAVSTDTAPAVADKAAVISAPLPQETAVEEKELEAATDKFIVVFSNIGGAVKSMLLKEYKDSATGVPMVLASIKNPREFVGSISSGSIAGLDTSAYLSERSADQVLYRLRSGDLEISKRYFLHKSKHGIDLEISIKNMSSSPKAVSYRLVGGSGVGESNPQDKRFVEVTSKINGKITGFTRPKNKRIISPGIVEWITLKNKYFSIILKPFTATKDQFYSEDSDGQLTMGLDTIEFIIPPGEAISNKYVFYFGPNHIPVLKDFGHGLEETVDYGFFGGISKFMLSVMRFFYAIVRSWGLSIILLSIFLNIVLFPLTIKSFKSMQKMQELHPQMDKLKKQYKDNPQKLNKEMMELYKTK